MLSNGGKGTKLRYSQMSGLEEMVGSEEVERHNFAQGGLRDCMKISSPRKSTLGGANVETFSHQSAINSGRDTTSKVSSPDNFMGAMKGVYRVPT